MPGKTEASIDELRDLCATAYQVVGSCCGPYELLNNLEDAAQGRPLRHDPGAGLPFVPETPIAQQWKRVSELLNADGRYDEADLEQMRKLFYLGACCCWQALFGDKPTTEAVGSMRRCLAVEHEIDNVVEDNATTAAANAR